MILDEIVEKKIAFVNERKNKVSQSVLINKAEELVSTTNEALFKKSLAKEGLSIIGEFKKSSPSKGVIVSDFNLEEISKYYDNIGVDAFSVLTEEEFFLGNDRYLKFVKSKFAQPVLRKDFIVDLYQIYESKVIGADAVLLIVSILKDKLKVYYEEAKKYNLDVLVEVHDKEELELALECNCDIIGINNRNLKTFTTTKNITKELIRYVPKDKIVISESGIKTIEDLIELRNIGVDGVLVGEMFMRNIKNNAFIENYKKFRSKDIQI